MVNVDGKWFYSNITLSLKLVKIRYLQFFEGISKEKQTYIAKVKTDLEIFWKDINPILEKIDERVLIQHVARLKFNIRTDPEIKSWYETEMRVNIYQFLFRSIINWVIK